MAQLLTLPLARVQDANGNVYPGAKLYAYLTGTTTPTPTYTDADLDTAHPNPIVADSGGFLPPIYFDPAVIYRFLAKTSAGANIAGMDFDPVSATSAGDIGFMQSGTGAVARTLLDKNREAAFSVTDFQVSPDATAIQNLNRFQLAVDAAADGDIVDVPPGLYEIDTTGGLSAAITINKRITIRLRGDIQANYSAIQTNPPYIFNLVADGAAIVGPGRIIGDGVINDTNTGDAETHPGLIRIAADGCIVSDVTLVNPPKVGILVYNCFFCDVSNNQFTGGPTVYGDTSHFYISVRFGGRHTFLANKFYPDADGGMCVQCIFASSANNCIIADNFAYRPYEKLTYWFGSGNTVSNNIVIGNDGFIPGTNIKGTITSVFRFHGSYNTIENNYSILAAGGATCIDGRGNQIINNRFLECGAAGIANTGSANNFDQTRIDGNTCTYAATAGVPVGSGILVVSSTGPSRQLSVSGNVVDGFSVADPIATIATWAVATAYGRNSVVKPSVGNGRYYVATTGGTSHATTEPTWPTTPAATIADNGVIWTTYAYEGGQAEINIQGAGVGQEIMDSIFAKNNTGGTTSRVGIALTYVKDTIVSDPRIVATQWGMSEGTSGATCSNIRWMYPMVTGVANTGVQNMSTTSAVYGMRLPWTPNQGAGLTVTGTFSSTGWYMRNGDLVTVGGELRATTGIANASQGIVCTNLPVAAAASGAGSLVNTDGVSPSGCFVIPAPDGAGAPATANPTTLYAGSTGTRSTLIFTLTYPVS